MREILFKAKRIETGEWVEGWIVPNREDTYPSGFRIIDIHGINYDELDYFEPSFISWIVDESTICQYTGLTDKNGNKIWENDVVIFKHEKFDFDYGLKPWEITCLPNKKEYKRNYAVEFCNTPTHYGLRFRNKSIWFMIHRMTIVMHDVEVIGNIFDNPELIGGVIA